MRTNPTVKREDGEKVETCTNPTKYNTRKNGLAMSS